MTGPVCPTHKRALICPVCDAAKRGMSKSPKKLAAIQANLRKAAAKRWPPKPAPGA